MASPTDEHFNDLINGLEDDPVLSSFSMLAMSTTNDINASNGVSNSNHHNHNESLASSAGNCDITSGENVPNIKFSDAYPLLITNYKPKDFPRIEQLLQRNLSEEEKKEKTTRIWGFYAKQSLEGVDFALQFQNCKINRENGGKQRPRIECKLVGKELDEGFCFCVIWEHERPEVVWASLLYTLKFKMKDNIEHVRWIMKDKTTYILVSSQLKLKNDKLYDEIKNAKTILLRRVFDQRSYVQSSLNEVVAKDTDDVFLNPMDTKNYNVHDHQHNSDSSMDLSDSMDFVQQTSTGSQPDEFLDNEGSRDYTQNSGLKEPGSKNNSPPTKKRKLDQRTSFENSSYMSALSEESSFAPSTYGIMYSELQFENLTCASCGNNDLINAEYLVIRHNLKVVFDVVARHFYHTSDQRLKYDIKEFNGAIKTLLQLDPKCFRWKNSEPVSDPIFGLIAQEVQKVAPSLVKEGEDGYLSVDYAQIIAIIIAATKQMLSDVHVSKDEQRVLRESIRCMEDKLRSLQTTIDGLVLNQKEQQKINEKISNEMKDMEERVNRLEIDDSRKLGTNCDLIMQIMFSEDYRYSWRMTIIQIFNDITLSESNWIPQRQHIVLRLVLLYPSFIGHFNGTQTNGILKNIEAVRGRVSEEMKAHILYCKAWLLGNKKKLPESREQYNKCLKLPGNTNKLIMAVKMGLAYIDDIEGDYGGALTKIDQCLVLYDSHLKSNLLHYHFTYWTAVRAKANIFTHLGRFNDAEKTLTESLRSINDLCAAQRMEPKKMALLKCPTEMQLVLVLLQKDAHKYANEVQTTYNYYLSTIGDDHYYSYSLHKNLASLHMVQENYKAAISQLEKCKEIVKQQMPSDINKLLEVTIEQISALTNIGDIDSILTSLIFCCNNQDFMTVPLYRKLFSWLKQLIDSHCSSALLPTLRQIFDKLCQFPSEIQLKYRAFFSYMYWMKGAAFQLKCNYCEAKRCFERVCELDERERCVTALLSLIFMAHGEERKRYKQQLESHAKQYPESKSLVFGLIMARTKVIFLLNFLQIIERKNDI